MRSTQTVSKTRPYPLQAELESAREVQRRFFPFRLPPVESLDYFGACDTAQQVGGDFFDFIAVSDATLTLSIGDVSGKGIPAALIMAGLQAALRALAGNGRPPLSSVVEKLSALLLEISPANFYATMFLAQIDGGKRELRYVSAGHEPALLVRDKARILLPLSTTGPALGVICGAEYRQCVVPLEPGDVLVAVTDGVSEAVGDGDSEAYESLVLDVLRRHPRATSSYLANHILRRLEIQNAEPIPVDDRTVVVVRTLPPEVPHARERDAEFVEPVNAA